MPIILDEEQFTAASLNHMHKGGSRNYGCDIDMIEIGYRNGKAFIAAVVDDKSGTAGKVSASSTAKAAHQIIAEQNHCPYFNKYNFLPTGLENCIVTVPQFFIVPQNTCAKDYMRKCLQIGALKMEDSQKIPGNSGFWLSEHKYYTMLHALKQIKPAVCGSLADRKRYFCNIPNCKLSELHVCNREKATYKLPNNVE